MSLRDRILDGARRSIGERLPGRLGQKRVAELTDQELEEELLRRRRARARNRSEEERGTHGTQKDSPQRKQLLQYYANLELEPGASVADVRRAYRELMQRYHPDKHRQDPARLAAANQLARSLTEAYEALLAHLE
jgi:DnaJ-domain-containing protein 1